MSSGFMDLSRYGITSTGLPEVDAKIGEIVTDNETRLTPEMRAFRDIHFGKATYESGQSPFIKLVDVDARGLVDRLVLTQEDRRELPEGFKEKAALLEEKACLARPSETFPDVTGWQLVINWGYFHFDAYRAQRAEALYPEENDRGLNAVREAFRKNPIVVISPVILSGYIVGAHQQADESFGMFGRYNQGDIVPAQVDLKEHPYMQERSFENKRLMQAIVDDFLFSKADPGQN